MPLTPKNRKEQWLEGLIQHETTLTPKNRPEAWMKEIIDASGGGTGGGALIVHEDADGVLDKTWQEIHDADFAVVLSPLPIGDGVSRNIVTFVQTLESGYLVQCMGAIGGSATFTNYSASTANDYPTYTE